MRNITVSVGLSLVGIVLVVGLWAFLSGTIAKDLPSPAKTWKESKMYIVDPWEKRGEMDQGILRMAAYSLLRVGKGFLLAILIGAPLGFILGSSTLFFKMFDPAIQVLRPISPLAWLPLGLVLFRQS